MPDLYRLRRPQTTWQCRLLISGCDAAEGGFEPAEEPFDLVAFFVEGGVEFGGQFAIGFGRDDGDGTLFPDHVSDPVSVISLVCEHILTGLQVVQELLAGRCVMGLSGR